MSFAETPEEPVSAFTESAPLLGTRSPDSVRLVPSAVRTFNVICSDKPNLESHKPDSTDVGTTDDQTSWRLEKSMQLLSDDEARDHRGDWYPQRNMPVLCVISTAKGEVGVTLGSLSVEVKKDEDGDGDDIYALIIATLRGTAKIFSGASVKTRLTWNPSTATLSWAHGDDDDYRSGEDNWWRPGTYEAPNEQKSEFCQLMKRWETESKAALPSGGSRSPPAS